MSKIWILLEHTDNELQKPDIYYDFISAFNEMKRRFDMYDKAYPSVDNFIMSYDAAIQSDFYTADWKISEVEIRNLTKADK